MMHIRSFFPCFLWGLAMLCACKTIPKKVSKADLVRYINDQDHDLYREQEVRGIKVSVTYHPSALLAQQELQHVQPLPQHVIDSVEKKYNDSYYFLLKFSKDGHEAIRQLGDFSSYSSMVNVLSFQMRQFVNATTTAKDTVELNDFMFDQTYGMSNGNTVLLCFDKQKLLNKEEIDINVSECGFGTGNLKFSFDQSDINKVPSLDYRKL
jgi:hypothetical protein